MFWLRIFYLRPGTSEAVFHFFVRSCNHIVPHGSENAIFKLRRWRYVRPAATRRADANNLKTRTWRAANACITDIHSRHWVQVRACVIQNKWLYARGMVLEIYLARKSFFRPRMVLQRGCFGGSARFVSPREPTELRTFTLSHVSQADMVCCAFALYFACHIRVGVSYHRTRLRNPVEETRTGGGMTPHQGGRGDDWPGRHDTSLQTLKLQRTESGKRKFKFTSIASTGTLELPTVYSLLYRYYTG
jgi:hypothetical protein